MPVLKFWNPYTRRYEPASGPVGVMGDAPHALFQRNTTLANNTTHTVTWDTAQRDSGGFWNPATPTRVLIPRTGWYLVEVSFSGSLGAMGSAGAYFHCNLNRNGAGWSVDNHTLYAAWQYPTGKNVKAGWFVAGDYVEASISNNVSGQTLTYVAQLSITQQAVGQPGPQGPAGFGMATGMVMPFAGASAPFGWLVCDGAAVGRAAYADLFAVVGTTYGVGDGSTTFNVPNLKGRVVVGVDAAQTEFDALGEAGGAKTNALTNNHVGTAVANPASESAHQHGVGGLSTGTPTGVGTTNAGGAVGYANSVHTHVLNGANTAAGSGHTHAQGAVTQPTAHAAVSTLQPYVALPYIIKT